MNHNQKLSAFEAWYFREFEVYPRRNESGGFKSQYVNAMFKAFSGGLVAGNGGAVGDGQSEPTMPQLEAFIKRAGFTYGWSNLESWARRMAEQAVLELNQAALASPEVQALKRLAKTLEEKIELYERYGPICVFEGDAMIHASHLYELSDAMEKQP